eukprot:364816-Chlamydomonas_euryale.AAC.5
MRRTQERHDGHTHACASARPPQIDTKRSDSILSAGWVFADSNQLRVVLRSSGCSGCPRGAAEPHPRHSVVFEGFPNSPSKLCQWPGTEEGRQRQLAAANTSPSYKTDSSCDKDDPQRRAPTGGDFEEAAKSLTDGDTDVAAPYPMWESHKAIR